MRNTFPTRDYNDIQLQFFDNFRFRNILVTQKWLQKGEITFSADVLVVMAA